MGDIDRDSVVLPDGKKYTIKDFDELTPNQRRAFTEITARLRAVDEHTMEDEFDDTALLLNLIFHDDVPRDAVDETPLRGVVALLDFFSNRALRPSSHSTGDSSEAASATSTK